MHRYLKKLNEIKISHLNSVGGKNASLGEMMNNLDELNINLPQGYALTTKAYNETYKNSIPSVNRSEKKYSLRNYPNQ